MTDTPKRPPAAVPARPAPAKPRSAPESPAGETPPGIAAAAPIAPGERQDRLARAQALMRDRGLGAMLVEAGSTLTYFTGVRWWRSERLTAAVIPADGPTLIVTPGFEEPSIREMLMVPAEVRVWQEHEDPFAVVAGWLKERGLAHRPVGLDETVRYFVVEGLKRTLPATDRASAKPVVDGCRMIKSAAELALLQRANDITQAAYRALDGRIEAGMTGADIFALMAAEMTRLGGERPSGGVQLDAGSALPHGSKAVLEVAEGSTILMDCGCGADGYRADISRTLVFGAPSPRQRTVWDQVRRGQDVVMDAAQPGRPAGAVDQAVRGFYERLGYGPGYALPGLSHRTGHGIGLDGHEPINLVQGETTPLAPGMCFSNEPGLYLPGAFGVRLEDCFHITAEGPRFFTTPPSSLDAPFG